MFEYQLGLPSEAREIRQKVFIEEQQFEEEFDELDEIDWHIVLYDGGVPIGTARVFADEKIAGVWHIGRVAILKEHRDKGLGRTLLACAESVVLERGGRVVDIRAQERAKGFYIKSGYRPIGDVFFDEDCLHIEMIKMLD